MNDLTTIIVSIISAIGLLGASGGVLNTLIKNRPSKNPAPVAPAPSASAEELETISAQHRADREEWRLERSAFATERQEWAAERQAWARERRDMEARHQEEVEDLRSRLNDLEEQLGKK